MIKRVQARLRSQAPENGGKPVAIRKSTNAGRFLCEFVYYASLAEIEQRRRREGDVPTKCVFIHIPSYDDRLIDINKSVAVVNTFVDIAIDDIVQQRQNCT